MTDNTQNGQCISCGECCSNTIALTQTDIARIKRYMKKHGITKPEDHTKQCGPVNVTPETTLDLMCPFLVIEQTSPTQKASCKIYSVRPAVCRSFTCQIASDTSKMEQIYENLQTHLTKNEIMHLANSPPVSMTTVFFGT